MPAVWLQLPQAGRRASVDDVERWVGLAEDAGFDGVWVGDHVALTVGSGSRYPYRPDRFPLEPATPFLEAFSLLTFAAARTTRVRLATAVAVAPLRHPVLLAKVTATLDVLSRGRLELGIAAGWHAEEMTALGAEFEARGAITDETLELLHRLWGGEPVTHHGRFTSLDGAVSQPCPAQQPAPPVWIGGHAPAALRRAARWGGRWIAAGLSLDGILEGKQRLGELLDGRPLLVAAQVAVHAGDSVPPGPLALSCATGDGLDVVARAGLDVVCLDVSAVARTDRPDAARAALALLRPRRSTQEGAC